MTQEMEAWKHQQSKLMRDFEEFNKYDSGYTLSHKQKFSEQRARLISLIKQDILNYPPFTEIAHNVCNSPFCFEECYDSMDGDMERTIKEIFSKEIDN